MQLMLGTFISVLIWMASFNLMWVKETSISEVMCVKYVVHVNICAVDDICDT
jgi:hypothetical protein